MDPTAERAAEAGLLTERATEWLAGEVIRAMAPVSDLDSVEEGGGHLAVQGDHPTCAAVGLYRAAELDHAWFVITDSRVAVLRLRDAQDAVLECPFEVPRFALDSIDRWKQPLVPEFEGGPRFVKIGFTDASWARVRTDEAGLTALVGSDA